MSTFGEAATRVWRKGEGLLHTLPDVVVLGAQKGGTTELYRRLADHPDFVPARRKEVHFFDHDEAWNEGVWWYRSFFPRRNLRHRRLTGEATPAYLFHEHAPERAARTLDAKCRFVVMLRDPVARAISNYLMEVRRNVEDRTFAEAAEYELREFEGWRPTHAGRERLEYLRFSYLHRGLYAEQLRRWFDHFEPDRFLVLRSEDFFAQPARTTSKVEAFVGLDARFEPEVECAYVPRTEFSDVEIPDFVLQFFRDDRSALLEMVGIGWDGAASY